MPICRGCKEDKAQEDFVHNYKNKSTYDTLCLVCNRQRRDEYRKKVPDSRKIEYQKRKASGKMRDYHMQYWYGISLEDYMQMHEEQDGKCAICGKPESKKKFMLAVDHNHDTNQVRQLLCSCCNMAIGLLKEDITTLANAIAYLNKWNSDA